MAMETGFQVMSTISTVRTSILHTQNPFFSKQTLSSFPVCSSSRGRGRGGLKGNNNTSSLPNSSFSRSSGDSKCRGSRIVSCKAREAINEVAVVTDASWSNLVMGSENPVLVEFWAPWCGPCRMIAPVIDELAKEYAGKIVCLKLNTDQSPGVASQYGIRSIPTVLLFKNGEKKDSVIGAVPKSTLTATIEKYL